MIFRNKINAAENERQASLRGEYRPLIHHISREEGSIAFAEYKSANPDFEAEVNWVYGKRKKRPNKNHSLAYE